MYLFGTKVYAWNLLIQCGLCIVRFKRYISCKLASFVAHAKKMWSYIYTLNVSKYTILDMLNKWTRMAAFSNINIPTTIYGIFVGILILDYFKNIIF
jgi:hypothetical protein